MKTGLIIPDTHVPFEDLKAYDLMLEVATFVKPDEIVILGDYLDFYSVSSHPKELRMNKVLLQREIECGLHRLDQLDKLFPKAKKVFIEGNHEYRLDRYLRDRCPDLFGMISVPKLLGLDRRPNWKFIPYGPYQSYKVLGSKLHARHEPIGPSAKSTATRSMCNIVFGHVHSIEESQVVSIDGSNYRAIGIGWLGDKNQSAFAYVKNHPQWSLGFGIVKVLDDKTFFHNTVHIIDYRCMYGEKIFEATKKFKHKRSKL